MRSFQNNFLITNLCANILKFTDEEKTESKQNEIIFSFYKNKRAIIRRFGGIRKQFRELQYFIEYRHYNTVYR